jgi:hypothetical protein
MYSVGRDGNRVTVVDWNGKVIYSVAPDAIVIYRTDPSGAVLSAKVSELTDQQLLASLANAVKLAI